MKQCLALVLLLFSAPLFAVPAPSFASLFEWMDGIPANFNAYAVRYILYPDWLKESATPEEIEKHCFDVWVIKPGFLSDLRFTREDLQGYLNDLPGGDFGDIGQPALIALALAENRVLAYDILKNTYGQSTEEWKARGLWSDSFGRNAAYEQQSLRDGRWPTIVITPAGQPFQTLWVLGVALDEGNGLPWEWRLVGRGLKGMPERIPDLVPQIVTPSQMAQTERPRRILQPGSFDDNTAYMDLMELLPSVRNARVEFRNYLRRSAIAPELAEEVHKIGVRQELHLLGAARIPDPLRREQEKRLLDLKNPSHPDYLFSDALLARKLEEDTPGLVDWLKGDGLNAERLFPTVHTTEIYIEANSYMRRFQNMEKPRASSKTARTRLYQQQYGITEITYSTDEDPEFGGPTDILRLSPRGYEYDVAAALRKRSPENKLYSSRIAPAPVGYSGLPCPVALATSQIWEHLFYEKRGVKAPSGAPR